jgi:hypothetical protein
MGSGANASEIEWKYSHCMRLYWGDNREKFLFLLISLLARETLC